MSTVTDAGQGTVLPSYDDDAPPPSPRTGIGRSSASERFDRYGALGGALALTWLLCERILPLHGVAWFLVIWFVTAIAMTVVVTLLSGSLTDVKDRVASLVITVGGLVVAAALVSTVVFVLVRGWHALIHLNFYTHDMAGVGPRDPYDKGGILHAIVGTAIEIALALLVTIPLLRRTLWISPIQ